MIVDSHGQRRAKEIILLVALDGDGGKMGFGEDGQIHFFGAADGADGDALAAQDAKTAHAIDANGEIAAQLIIHWQPRRQRRWHLRGASGTRADHDGHLLGKQAERAGAQLLE